MRLSKKTRYGLRAMLELALHGGEGRLSARAISERQDIPLQYLEQIFNRLKKKGLIRTARGPKGGYSLARRPSSITVRDVTHALDDADFLTECLSPGRQSCGRTDICLARRFWKRLYKNIDDFLASNTLEDLCAASSAADKVNNINHSYLFQI